MYRGQKKILQYLSFCGKVLLVLISTTLLRKELIGGVPPRHYIHYTQLKIDYF